MPGSDASSPPTGDSGPRTCTAATQCDDGRACTADLCAVGGVCQNRDTCPTGMACSATGCIAGGCTTDAECDDTIACTIDACGVGNVCSHITTNSLCTGAGEVCDATMGCMRPAGACTTDAECNDMVACTIDACGVGNRCTHQGVDSMCPMGSSCRPTGCSRSCTVDGDCQDMNFCNGAEVCEPEFGCAPARSVRDCNDANPCTADSCDATGNRCNNVCMDGPGCPACPRPDPPCNGAFALTPPPAQSCLGVNYRIPTVRFECVGPILQVRAGTNTLSQSTPRTGGQFDVSVMVDGGCIERYRLMGTFTDADTFSGTWTSDFINNDGFSCGLSGCQPVTISVMGRRM